LPDLPVAKQLELLKSQPIDDIVCYPSSSLIQSQIDVAEYDDRPFTKSLVLGAAQLEFVGFKLTVLDRYLEDPRYHCNLGDYSGSISIGNAAGADETFPQRDKVLLERFGLGYTDAGRRILVVFLRYLHQLSPEHQQAWSSYRVTPPIKMLKDYYQNTVMGAFTKNVSYFTAILKEVELINKLSIIIFKRYLFIHDFSRERPAALTFFRLPTLKNFNEFILTMDKLLSDNLNKDFFRGTIPVERETERADGRIVVHQIGTLQLLEDWVRTTIQWENEDDAVKIILYPFRQIRKLRQNPAHKIEENRYDKSYEERQRELLCKVYQSVAQLRFTLSNHPSAPQISLPAYLEEGNIVFF
jgi:hypothetical protein